MKIKTLSTLDKPKLIDLMERASAIIKIHRKSSLANLKMDNFKVQANCISIVATTIWDSSNLIKKMAEVSINGLEKNPICMRDNL